MLKTYTYDEVPYQKDGYGWCVENNEIIHHDLWDALDEYFDTYYTDEKEVNLKCYKLKTLSKSDFDEIWKRVNTKLSDASGSTVTNYDYTTELLEELIRLQLYTLFDWSDEPYDMDLNDPYTWAKNVVNCVDEQIVCECTLQLTASLITEFIG